VTASELRDRAEAERKGTPFIVYRDSENLQHVYDLGGSEYVALGRSSTSDVKLDWDSGVSRLHAEMQRAGDDWIIVDDGLSRNGTYVNGDRLGGRRRLCDGDSVRVGDTMLVFHAPRRGETGTTAIGSDFLTAASLSVTQRKVLAALCRPFKGSNPFATPATNQQIAEEVYLSVDAVKTHLRTLFAKLQVGELPQNQKRARLVEIAFKNGLISERDL
jgi:pSer/pThr/pTyr-binding forkhead associated (FHA) protein